jgi:hypothetical protein
LLPFSGGFLGNCIVRKPKNNNNPQAKGLRPQHTTVSPTPTLFGGKKTSQDPVNLKREISTPNQRNWAEGTILYGEDDALPLRIAQAVEESPAASSCIDTIGQFIKGSGFSEPELMELKIDSQGTKLWDLHCQLSESLALFWGFAVNFKFNNGGRIINTYQMPFESCRFKEPGEKSPFITHIKYNPYFGTLENKKEYTKEYDVFNIKEVANQINKLTPADRKVWQGQIYYYGKTSPLHRFYPVPKYWSAKEAIQADHKLQEFHNEELDNGFFQSVLINAIGNPNEMSKNPNLQKEITQTDGTKKKVATHTIGQEFNEQMAETFSGSKKAGTAMVLWSLNANEAIKVQAFPTGINGDRIISTQDSITKTITIATRVPSILANISEGVSLGSGGSEMQKAVELMQSRTAEWRTILQNFYNEVLLPNLEKPVALKVEIQNFNPISEPVEIEDKFWDFMNDAEKIAFMKKNLPHVEIIRTETAPVQPVAPVINPETGEPEPVQAPPQVNESLKNLNQKQLDRVLSVVGRYNIWLIDPTNKKALTFEQAKSFLLSYGILDSEISIWLSEPNEEL